MAMSISDIAVGKKIRFKINSTNDNIYHTGTVVSVGSYSIASRFTDIDAAYRDLRLSGSSVTAVKNDTYVILEYINNVGVSQVTAYGMSWINTATLELVSENTYGDIRVYDITRSDLDEILNYVKSLGYSSDIQVYPSE